MDDELKIRMLLAGWLQSRSEADRTRVVDAIMDTWQQASAAVELANQAENTASVAFDQNMKGAYRAAANQVDTRLIKLPQAERAQIADIVRKSLGAQVGRNEATGMVADVLRNMGGMNGLTSRQAASLVKMKANGATQKQLDRAFERKIRARSRVIARTEMMRANNAGRVAAGDAAAEALGVPRPGWKWIAARVNVCPVCTPMDGMTRPADGMFHPSTGPVMFPPAHPNCRCTVREWQDPNAAPVQETPQDLETQQSVDDWGLFDEEPAVEIPETPATVEAPEAPTLDIPEADFVLPQLDLSDSAFDWDDLPAMQRFEKRQDLIDEFTDKWFNLQKPQTRKNPTSYEIWTDDTPQDEMRKFLAAQIDGTVPDVSKEYLDYIAWMDENMSVYQIPDEDAFLSRGIMLHDADDEAAEWLRIWNHALENAEAGDDLAFDVPQSWSFNHKEVSDFYANEKAVFRASGRAPDEDRLRNVHMVTMKVSGGGKARWQWGLPEDFEIVMAPGQKFRLKAVNRVIEDRDGYKLHKIEVDLELPDAAAQEAVEEIVEEAVVETAEEVVEAADDWPLSWDDIEDKIDTFDWGGGRTWNDLDVPEKEYLRDMHIDRTMQTAADDIMRTEQIWETDRIGYLGGAEQSDIGSKLADLERSRRFLSDLEMDIPLDGGEFGNWRIQNLKGRTKKKQGDTAVRWAKQSESEFGLDVTFEHLQERWRNQAEWARLKHGTMNADEFMAAMDDVTEDIVQYGNSIRGDNLHEGNLDAYEEAKEALRDAEETRDDLREAFQQLPEDDPEREEIRELWNQMGDVIEEREAALEALSDPIDTMVDVSGLRKVREMTDPEQIAEATDMSMFQSQLLKKHVGKLSDDVYAQIPKSWTANRLDGSVKPEIEHWNKINKAARAELKDFDGSIDDFVRHKMGRAYQRFDQPKTRTDEFGYKTGVRENSQIDDSFMSVSGTRKVNGIVIDADGHTYGTRVLNVSKETHGHAFAHEMAHQFQRQNPLQMHLEDAFARRQLRGTPEQARKVGSDRSNGWQDDFGDQDHAALYVGRVYRGDLDADMTFDEWRVTTKDEFGIERYGMHEISAMAAGDSHSYWSAAAISDVLRDWYYGVRAVL